MCSRGKFNFVTKVLSVLILAGGLMLLPVTSFAQDLPCADLDPTGTVPCPLDTWVWVLVFAATIFGAVQLYRRQKMQAGV